MKELAGLWPAILLAGAAFLLSAPLVFLVPPGEAPDEPAHVAYVHHVVAEGTLPPAAGASGIYSYEFYQPPLAYLAMAVGVRAAGFRSLEYPFNPDPSFAFQRGARAFRRPPRSVGLVTARKALLVARFVNLAWVLLAASAIFLTCRQLTSSSWIALAAAAPFALAPQLLFVSAIVGNDAAVTALVVAATFCLVILASRSCHPLVPIAASTAAGLAPWAKASAIVIAPAVALTFTWLAVSRRWRDAMTLLLPGLVLSAGWVLMEAVRTGSALPSPPTGWDGGPGVTRLLTKPWWIVSVWGSFWAKLGWFNIELPRPVYLVFVPPTLAAVLGFIALRRLTITAKAGWLLVAIVASNIALMCLYLARVDWQPQGRYLLPAAAAAAGLATIGIDRLCSAWSQRAKRRLALISCALAVATALIMLVVLSATYP